jgi:hypothetical protein
MNTAPVRAVAVPAPVVGRFEPVAADEWRRMDNNTKARFGKLRFLELLGALDATPERAPAWLEGHGLSAGRREWVEVAVAPGLAPRYINLAYTTRCVDAFLTDSDGELQGSRAAGLGKLTAWPG